jgi:hypothetical protein
MVPSARLELALLKGKDFKSFVSTNFTTRALFSFELSTLFNSNFQILILIFTKQEHTTDNLKRMTNYLKITPLIKIFLKNFII